MTSLMIQGTSSGAGKTILTAALCRIFSDRGFSVAPFKSQNMSNFSYRGRGFEISRAQAVQAVAARCQISPNLNPILLKPLGNYYSTVFLNGKKFKKMHASEYYDTFVRTDGMKLALESFYRLEKQYDMIILEGAGSPAEINLTKYDIANMKIAKRVKSNVLLISDIDRGGSFASIVGTLALLDSKAQDLVKGFVINKFRGDLNILKPGLKKLEKITKKPVLGVIPMTEITLPEEDSLGMGMRKFAWDESGFKMVDREVAKIARLVEQNLNIGEILELAK
ncbi:MAG: cobyric acid synthase [Thaumarchaeota archaeon]|nr:cobyric acid synthase [Nitrososphaerota archaeon]